MNTFHALRLRWRYAGRPTRVNGAAMCVENPYDFLTASRLPLEQRELTTRVAASSQGAARCEGAYMVAQRDALRTEQGTTCRPGRSSRGHVSLLRSRHVLQGMGGNTLGAHPKPAVAAATGRKQRRSLN